MKLELSSQRRDALRSAVRQAVAVVLAADGRWVDPVSAKDAELRAQRVSALRVQNLEESKLELRVSQVLSVQSPRAWQRVRRASGSLRVHRRSTAVRRGRPVSPGRVLCRYVLAQREHAAPRHEELPGVLLADALREHGRGPREPRVSPAAAAPALSAPRSQARALASPAADDEPSRQPRAGWNSSASSFPLHQAPAKDR